MDCEGFRNMLDAYIDGMLSEDEMQQFMAHADACEECREELRAAQMLRDMMKDMDDDIVVPLQAQAAWRNAVRAEAKKRNVRRIMRVCYGAAAALVLFAGVNFVLGGEKDVAAPEMQPMMLAANELIARDGDAEEAAVAAEAGVGREYTCMRKIEAEDYDSACMTIELLCAEYSGTFTAQAAGSGAGKSMRDYRIELPYEYMADFLNAASRIGTEIASENNEDAARTAVILIQLCEK